MEEQLINCKTAKLAKEKGFNEPTMCAYYYSEKDFRKGLLLKWNERKGWVDKYSKPHDVPFYAVCSQSIMQKWLREKHMLHIKTFCPEEIIDDEYNYTKWCFSIHKIDGNELFFSDEIYDSYEEALEAGLIGTLNLIE